MIRVLLLILAFFISVSAQSQRILPPAAEALIYNPKISPILSLQLRIKQTPSAAFAKQPGILFPELGVQTSGLNIQRVHARLTDRPDARMQDQMDKVGAKIYPESWIPPVGDHNYGFLLLELPVDSVNRLADLEFVRRITSADRLLWPKNNLGATSMGTEFLWPLGYDGSGVRIAILDSGLDTDHADFPVPLVAQDYSNYPTLDSDVENQVTGHGTHVSGSVLGRGLQSSGRYRGSAPDADLIFLKIGNDVTGGASTSAIDGAMRDAVDLYDADIITMSYGGWSTFHDGSSTEDLAVDYAVSQGATVFISAGNDGGDDYHYSGTVPAGGNTGYIEITVTGAGVNTTGLAYNMVWYDGLSINRDLDLEYYNSAFTLLASTIGTAQMESDRGTEAEFSYHDFFVSNGTYYVRVFNNSGSAQDFHLYYSTVFNTAGGAVFASPDPFYTLGSPSTADSAITVGAHVTRKFWTNFQGNTYSYTSDETVDEIATFSSRGPRIDDQQKISLTAPGTAIVSARDTDLFLLTDPDEQPLIIDNDGINNGLGPADYYIMQGTSMSTPLAAGAAALLLEKDSTLTPSEIRSLLFDNARSDAQTGTVPNNTWGYGKLDIESAMESLNAASINSQTVAASGSYDFSGTDVEIDFSVSGDSGQVSVARVNGTPAGGMYNVSGGIDHVSGIRYWQIGTDKSGYTADIVFTYDVTTDQINNENTLLIARRDTETDVWAEYGSIFRDPANDQIHALGVTGFSEWILAAGSGDNPLPVSLNYFKAYEKAGHVVLRWQTASEINNRGFNVYRGMAGTENIVFDRINTALIDGAGSDPAGRSYSLVDSTVRVGNSYLYTLESVSVSGTVSREETVNVDVRLPQKINLFANYPNPFNSLTRFRYALNETADVRIMIFNVLGEEILVRDFPAQSAGYHIFNWDGRTGGTPAASGIYFYSLQTPDARQIRKMILVR